MRSKEICDCGVFIYFFPFLQKMSSLVERLRVRSERRPLYNLDISDDEADVGPGKSGQPAEKPERIDREDAVCDTR